MALSDLRHFIYGSFSLMCQCFSVSAIYIYTHEKNGSQANNTQHGDMENYSYSLSASFFFGVIESIIIIIVVLNRCCARRAKKKNIEIVGCFVRIFGRASSIHTWHTLHRDSRRGDEGRWENWPESSGERNENEEKISSRAKWSFSVFCTKSNLLTSQFTNKSKWNEQKSFRSREKSKFTFRFCWLSFFRPQFPFLSLSLSPAIHPSLLRHKYTLDFLYTSSSSLSLFRSHD